MSKNAWMLFVAEEAPEVIILKCAARDVKGAVKSYEANKSGEYIMEDLETGELTGLESPLRPPTTEELSKLGDGWGLGLASGETWEELLEETQEELADIEKQLLKHRDRRARRAS